MDKFVVTEALEEIKNNESIDKDPAVREMLAIMVEMQLMNV